MSSFKLAALVGSTASGKSDLALQIAKQTGAEIISCDSLLIYRDLNIGTAKPTPEEMEGIPHHAINLIDLKSSFNAGDYIRYARAVIEDLKKKNKPGLLVGGTGFYLKALLCGVWDAPPTQKEFRQKLEDEFAGVDENKKKAELHKRLEKQDPTYAAKIPAGDSYRVIRALEIIHATGKTIAEVLANQKEADPLPYDCPVFGIKRNKRELDRRILDRTNKMFQKGLVEETKKLSAQYDPLPRAFFCVGYKEVLQFLKQEMTLPECRERVFISTRQLAKKQMTFLKTFPKPIEWIDLPENEFQLVSNMIKVLSQ